MAKRDLFRRLHVARMSGDARARQARLRDVRVRFWDYDMNKLWWCLWGCSALGLLACGDDETNCDEPGRACTWLGLPGESGFNGDGKDRLETKMYWSMDMTFGPDGTPWFIDWNNHMVRRVLPDQTVE